MGAPTIASPFPPYGYMPDQKISNWTDKDYIENIRFIAAQWNFNVMTASKWTIDLAELGLPLGFAQRAFLWRDYYFGNALNVNYDHVLLKEDGSRKLVKMFAGKDIMKFVNYAIEPIIDVTKRIPKIIKAECVSPDVVSRKRFLMDFQKFTAGQANFTSYLNDQFGVYYQTSSGKKFLTDAQGEMDVEDFREGLEIAAKNIGKDIFYRNHLNELFVDVGKDAFITGVGCIKQTVEDGYVLLERVPIWEAIFPPNTGGDQHRTDPYAGRVRFMTVQEVLAKYPELSDTQKEDIQTMAKSSNGQQNLAYAWGNFNISGNFLWWGMNDGVPRIAVVDAQWASYEKGEGDKHRQCLRQGTLIGNKYLIKEGVSTNQTKDWRSVSDTNLDYQFVQPMSVFGRNMGYPEMLYTYQNQIDAWQTKINEWIAQTKGTFYFVFGEALPPGKDSNWLASEISDKRIAVVKGTDADAGEQVKKIMEQGAIEMPRDVTVILNQIASYRAMMADILNIPDAARGQLEGYQGQKTLNTQLAQSGKGTRFFYDPINIFFERVIQKAVDKFKVASMDNPNFEYQLIIGDTQTEMFKATKDFGLSHYAMYIGFEDLVDDATKQRMADTILAYAQNSQVTGYALSDYYAIESMTTNTEIRNFLQFRERQIADQKAAEAQQAMQMQQMQSEQANQTQENITAMNNQSADARETAKIQSNENIHGTKIMADLAMAQQKQPGA